MNKRFCTIAAGLMMVASVASAQDLYHIPAGTPMYEVHVNGVSNGGTLVYDNSFPQISGLPACGGLSCEACGNFFTTGIWTSGNNRYYSDDIGLGAGPRSLVRYNFIVCGNSGPAGSPNLLVDITSSLWTTNLSGVSTDAPGAPIAGTQSTTQISVPAAPGACFTIEVKTGAGIVLPNNLHLVVTSSLQSTSTGSPGTGIAVLDGAEYGTNANQHRRSLAGLATQPDPNDNADWAGAAFFSATPNCPSAGAGGCTSGCAPYAAAWGHIYAEGNCGNGVVEPGEQCDGGACCQACQYSAAGSQCRAAATSCDASESCDGMSANCPADLPAAAGTTCRSSAGPCDPFEMCDGSSFDCPPDVTITMCIDGDGCCPTGCDNSNDDDCAPVGVPTVSEWGLAILTLIGLVVGTVMFSRRRVALN